MKILIINCFYFPNLIGGTENSIKILADELANRGNEVAVFTTDANNKFLVEEINNVRVYRSTGKNVYYTKEKKNRIKKFVYKLIELRNYFVLTDLRKALNEFKPDVVHTNNLFNMSPYVLKYIKKNNIKIVHTIRDYWFMCPHSTLLNNKSEICENASFLCKIYRNYYRYLSKFADVVTAPSNFTLDLLIKNGYFKNSKAICVSNAIDFNEEEVIKNISKREKNDNVEVNFLFIGNLHKSKGIEYLIETFKSINNKNIKLIICGKGQLEHYVKQAALADKRIIYKGAVYETDKKNVLLESDVLIIPSIWYEPFGRVIIEAYKYGMPVIGTDMGGIPEVIDNNLTGVIVNAYNKSGLEAAIRYFSNRDVVNKHLCNIPKKLDKYSVKKQIDKFLEIYKYGISHGGKDDKSIEKYL